MSLSRLIILLLIVAVLGIVTLKVVRMRQEQQESRVETVQGEQLRRFWESYREASQKRAANDLTAAVILYQDALQLKPDHEDSLYYSGNCYFELGRYQEAILAYQRLIAVNPLGSSRGYVQLGLVHACLKPGAPFDPEKAERFFQQALQVDPDSGAMLGIAEVALLQGKWQKAWEALQSERADHDMSMATPYLLGYLCWRKGDHKEAWRWFRASVERGEFKKPAITWSEEGDVKADPEWRWRALARQSVLGEYWLRLRRYVNAPDLSPANMEEEYQLLRRALATANQYRAR